VPSYTDIFNSLLFGATYNKVENFMSIPSLPMSDFKIQNDQIDYMYFACSVMKDVVGYKFLFNDS